MMEKRRFQRVRFDARCLLLHNNISHLGQVVNISLNGALISFNDGLVIPLDERCRLEIYLDGEEHPLTMEVEVVHSNFTMLGIKFSEMDSSQRVILSEAIERTFEKDLCDGTNHTLYPRELEG